MKVKLQPLPEWLLKAKPDSLCEAKDIYPIFGYKTANSLTCNFSGFPGPCFKRGDQFKTGAGRMVLFRKNYWKVDAILQEYYRRKDLQELMAIQ